MEVAPSSWWLGPIAVQKLRHGPAWAPLQGPGQADEAGVESGGFRGGGRALALPELQPAALAPMGQLAARAKPWIGAHLSASLREAFRHWCLGRPWRAAASWNWREKSARVTRAVCLFFAADDPSAVSPAGMGEECWLRSLLVGNHTTVTGAY